MFHSKRAASMVSPGATDYNSGNAFHVDVSAMKFLTKELTVSAIASYYQ
jgi:hypothetical protein